MLCKYGCEQEAKFFFKNGSACCSSHRLKCPKVSETHSIFMKKRFKNPEVLKKHSILMKERFDNIPDLKSKISVSNKKTHGSEEYIQKQKDIMKKLHSDNPDFRKKQGAKVKKYYENPENRRRISEIKKKQYVDNPELKNKLSIIQKDCLSNQEERKKVSDGQKKRFSKIENRKTHSEIRKKFLNKHPEVLEKHSKFMKNFLIENPEKHPVYILNQNGYISSIEKKMMDLLSSLNINYEHNFPIHRYFADFAILNKNIIIECDGDYWHSLPGAKERDSKRDKTLLSLGWKTLRFSENQINKNLNSVKKILLNLINIEE